jgi:hypothetical protein
MKLRPVNIKEFLKWYQERLCKHPVERLVMTGDDIVCQNCLMRFIVSETTFAQYASQFVICTDGSPVNQGLDKES